MGTKRSGRRGSGAEGGRGEWEGAIHLRGDCVGENVRE